MRNRSQSKALLVVAFALAVALTAPALLVASVSDAPVADAAEKGDLEAVRALLREGADVNAAQGDGMSALHWSALRGDAEIIDVLLYAGANLESLTRLGGYTPLHLATMEGRGDAVARLLAAGSDAERLTDTGVTPLHLAAQAGEPTAVAALIEAGVDIDARDAYGERTPLHYATANGRLQAMSSLLAAGAEIDAVTAVTDYVAKSRDDGLARTARNRIRDAELGRTSSGRRGFGGGAPPTPQPAQRGGTTPPQDPDDPPARGGRGGRATTTPPDPDDPADPPARPAAPPRPTPRDPNAPRALSGTQQIGQQGAFTALHYAARDGRMDEALMLLEAGADIEHRTADETTPLLLATINGNFDLAMELLERGADPNALSDDDVGPLFAAINQEWHLRTWYPQPTANEQQETSYLELMHALLEAGADPDVRTKTHVWYAAYNAGRMGVDFTGATAFWRSAYALDVEAMKLLIEFGADPNISTVSFGSRTRRNFGGSARPQNPNEPEEPEPQTDPSGLPPSIPGSAAVHPLHAASGVGFGTSRVGQQHRHVPEGWMAAVEYLVDELGVDVNVRDHAGYSALHNAAGRGDNEMILFLIERGGDPTVVSRRGQTTIDMANGPQQRVQPFPETIALLERFGAINNHNCISC